MSGGGNWCGILCLWYFNVIKYKLNIYLKHKWTTVLCGMLVVVVVFRNVKCECGSKKWFDRDGLP